MKSLQRTTLYFAAGIAASVILTDFLTGLHVQDQPDRSNASAAQAQTQPGNHVTIRVPNFEQTKRWYEQNLGFREVQRFTNPDMPGIQFTFLERNGFRIEVIAGGAPRRLSQPPANPEAFVQEQTNVQGYNHIGLRVDDVDAMVAAMRRRSVKIVIEPVDVPFIRTRLAHVQDNSGNDIELVQPM
jgi:catechol 2,3-dioxygenase-like lactoylglutathione lyase family enzyme